MLGDGKEPEDRDEGGIQPRNTGSVAMPGNALHETAEWHRCQPHRSAMFCSGLQFSVGCGGSGLLGVWKEGENPGPLVGLQLAGRTPESRLQSRKETRAGRGWEAQGLEDWAGQLAGGGWTERKLQSQRGLQRVS